MICLRRLKFDINALRENSRERCRWRITLSLQALSEIVLKAKQLLLDGYCDHAYCAAM